MLKKYVIAVAVVLVVLVVAVAAFLGLRAPAEEPMPPGFEAANLKISPAEVAPGQPVNISVEVRNVGEERGTHNVVLRVDGNVEGSQEIALEGGETKTVSFTIKRNEPRSHTVRIAHLSGTFRVQAPPKVVRPPQGKIAFRSQGYIHIINPDGTNEIRLTEGTRPVWSPDGQRIAYSHRAEGEHWAIWVINSDGTGKTRVFDNFTGRPRWSPCGEKILITVDEEAEVGVYIIDVDTRKAVRLVENRSIAAIFSPDGEKVAYLAHRGNRHFYDLWVMYSEGTGKIKLSEDIFIEHAYALYDVLAWSPDGKKIAYACGRDLYIIDADGSNKMLIASGLLPAWSPDSKRIAYYSGRADLFLVNPDGTGKINLFDGGIGFASLMSPSWSPDGKTIVFGRGEEVYLVNADGSGLRKLAFGMDAQWSPVP